MTVRPMWIALGAAGLLIVGGAVVAAPALGDLLSSSATQQSSVVGVDPEYGVNANGETFGSPVGGSAPMLIPARSDEGELGYIRVSELDLKRNIVRSSADADATATIDVYQSDGETVVGSMTVDKQTPGPRDGFNN